ncbi:MAG: HemK2/MTQ2 family protein methyltransferase [Candidatus Pacearchaeota archaeon]
MSQIYSPREDSHLMERALKKELPSEIAKNPDLNFLEIGSGSGIILETASALGIKKENILGTDINKDAVEHCKERGFSCIYSDLFEKAGEKYDIIVFNPPYLPKNSEEPEDSQLATTGGENGNKVITRFLEKAKNYLKSNGKIYLLISSLTKDIDWKGYNKELVEKSEIFMETLFVWRLEKS